VLHLCGVAQDDRSQQQVTALVDQFLKKLKACVPPSLLAVMAAGPVSWHENMMAGTRASIQF
jgi:hypothetical protein